jgi:hypothetical protein
MRAIVILFLALFLNNDSYAQLRINEIMSLNTSAYIDNQNNYSDWIELYNTNSDSLLLSDYYLSDDREMLYKWQLPKLNIEGMGFFNVYASGQNSDLHCNFKISSQGETIYLSQLDNGLIDSIPAVVLTENQSFGRYPDGSDEIGKLATTTPNASNDSIFVGYSNLSFSHSSGFYNTAISLSINPSNNNAEIYFTTNGSDPSLTDFNYSESLYLEDLSHEANTISEIPTSENWLRPKTRIFKGHIIKAAAFENGQQISPVYTQSYFVSPQMKERYTFPIVSLSTSPQNLFDEEMGIYVKGQSFNYSQRGRAWERMAHFEYFDTQGHRLINQKIGLRTNGNIGRTLAQKSLLLYARDSYGKKRLKHPFFKDKETDSFKRIILRSASSNDWKNTMFKNELAQRIVTELNFEHPASQEVIVFINGRYWGIHHLNERTDEYFISDYFDKENIDILSNDASVEEGDNADFITLKSYIQENDLRLEEHYQHLSTLMDIDNIIDYYCAQLFFSNTDWPHNNIKYWKAKNEGKWRWLFFDCDECMSYEYYNLMADLVNEKNSTQDFPEWSTFIIRNLFKNNSFKLAFRQRFEALLSTTFATENIIQHIQAMELLYRPEIDEHCLRWDAPSNSNDWQEAVNGLYSFATLRPQYMREQLKDYFGNPFSIYPNPATHGLLNIDILTHKNSVESIRILNSLGQRVFLQNGSWNNPIALPTLKNGVYIVQLRFTDRIYNERLIIQ